MPVRTRRIVACFVAGLLVLAALAAAQVRVRGYFRKDGTYVRPHVRTYPDGSPYNNYSFPGNYNPNTGKITPGDPLKYLERYYREKGGLPLPPVSSPGKRTRWEIPLEELTALPRLPREVATDEFGRSRDYCAWLYGAEEWSRRQCEARQFASLRAIMLPDYKQVQVGDLKRIFHYCEWIFGDNRAGFYNCMNRQILGLGDPKEIHFEPSDHEDASRAKAYCEWIFGDNRAGFQSCLKRQAKGLAGESATGGGLPPQEWNRSRRYCEWIFGDNRAGYQGCLKRQRSALQGLTQQQLRTVPESTHDYCEWIFDDNRAGYWGCVRRRS